MCIRDSILLAILPSLYGLPNGHFYFNVVFVMVLASLLVQGWTIPAMARALHQMVPQRSSLVDRVEIVNIEQRRFKEIGYRSGSGRQPAVRSVPKEALMLTQDENIVDMRLAVQYQILSLIHI